MMLLMQLLEKTFEVSSQQTQSKLSFTGTSEEEHKQRSQKKQERYKTRFQNKVEKEQELAKRSLCCKGPFIEKIIKIAKDRKDLTNPEFWALTRKSVEIPLETRPT